jgi:hypothetical protein
MRFYHLNSFFFNLAKGFHQLAEVQKEIESYREQMVWKTIGMGIINLFKKRTEQNYSR